MEFNSLVYPAPESKGSFELFMASASMRKMIHIVDMPNQSGEVDF